MLKLRHPYLILHHFFLLSFTLFLVEFNISRISYAADEQNSASYITLDKAIQEALTANIGIRISAENIQAALNREKSSRAAFYPSLSATYQYQHNDEASEVKIPIPGAESNPIKITLTPEERYSFSTTVTQPIFAGMSILNQYKISELGVSQAKFQEAITRQDIISQTKSLYFNLLKTNKLNAVAEQSVTLLQAHRNVAENFHKVGMSPLNDLLKAEVELANARQDLVRAQNALTLAESNLNLLLRRSVNTPIMPKDISNYETFDKDLETCLKTAEENRLEMQIADIDIQIREKELALTRKDFYPAVNLQGTYTRIGDQWDVNGDDNMDADSWNIQAIATWTFWDWGKTQYGAEEQKHRVSQSRLKKLQIQDQITLEVKEAFLKAKESEKNIATVEKAVAQAQESHRISEERYNEQMATSTDVLDAQTLLTQTRTNYYNALYDFEISKASLDRAMGLPLQTLKDNN
ncbi:MAG: TolC family protein [Desulfobacteraceae bacterium]|jgi:outer membrane protein TolC